MEYIVVTFRARTDTMKFYDLLKNYGIKREIISTPKEAKVGCGLSVKIDKADFYNVKRILFDNLPKSFAGFFVVTERFGKRSIKSF